MKDAPTRTVLLSAQAQYQAVMGLQRDVGGGLSAYIARDWLNANGRQEGPKCHRDLVLCIATQ